MTNLLILYPDIPGAAKAKKTYTDDTAEGPNEDSFHPARNTLRGERYQMRKSSYTATEHNLVYDCGTTSGVDNTKSASFVVLSRLDILRDASAVIDFALQSSSDDVTYTDRHTITDLTTATLSGPWSNDYVSIFTETSAYRYWRTNFPKSSGSDFQLKIGKIYFGNAFDMGRDPAWQIERVTSGDVSFLTSGGIEYPGRIQHPRYEIALTWTGVSDANLSSFMTTIVSKRYTTPVFLYTSSFHDPLDGKGLIHCKLVDIETQHEYTNWNNIRAKFVEVIG